jgi:hypothetical protein
MSTLLQTLNIPTEFDLRAFNVTYRALDRDGDKQLENGEGNAVIQVAIIENDTVLAFSGGSIRIEDTTDLRANDFFF